MAGNVITSDELAQFKSLAVKKKVDSMELYLIGSNGYKYNMQEVGARVFGDENYSYTVSLIHRCYNFSGQNGGKYRNGCKFEQITGYRVSRSDIEAFVKKYPNGTFNNGVIFEDFLKTRVKSGSIQHRTFSATKNVQRSTTRKQGTSRQITNSFTSQQNYYVPQNNIGNDISPERLKMLMLGLGCIGGLILMILLFTGGLFRHWIISLIVLLFTVGAFAAIRQI